MKFKKYILFQYDYYFPTGGLEDITESFDTVEEAEVYVKEGHYCDFNTVVDRDTWEEVKEIEYAYKKLEEAD